jgi:putative phage-type endonuclease
MISENENCQTRSDWLRARRNGIGGSEAPVIMGCGYISEIELWERKVFPKEETEEERENYEWGTILEDPLARRYEYKTGRRLEDPGRFSIVFSAKYPFAHCTIDRQIPFPQELHSLWPRKAAWPDYADGPGSLSIKNAGWYMEDDWEEEPPLAFQVQMQHELAVREWQWGSFAVLLGGNKFRWADCKRNQGFIDTLMELEAEFWHKVQHGIRPNPDASQSAARALFRIHPKDNGQSITLPVDSFFWSKNLREAKAIIKKWEEIRDISANRLKAAIGNNTIGLFPSVLTDQLSEMPAELSLAIVEHPKEINGYTWKHQDRAAYKVEQSETRVLREQKSKKAF